MGCASQGIGPRLQEDCITRFGQLHMAEKKLHAQAAQLPPDLDRTPYLS
jgi:hypothetical protein